MKSGTILASSQWTHTVHGKETGTLSSRIILRYQRFGPEEGESYSTHEQVRNENKSLSLFYGHYDMTWLEALQDFIKRVRQLLYQVH